MGISCGRIKMQLRNKPSFGMLREEEDKEDQESHGGELLRWKQKRRGIPFESSECSPKIESIGIALSRPYALQRATGIS